MLRTCVFYHSLKEGGGEGKGESGSGRRRNRNSDDAGFKFPIPSSSYCLHARGVCMVEASTEFNARAQGRENREGTGIQRSLKQWRKASKWSVTQLHP